MKQLNSERVGVKHLRDILQYSSAIRGLPDGGSEQELEDILAQVIVSTLVEPGDPVGGAIIAELGARAVLGQMFDSEPGDLLSPGKLSPVALAKSLRRWRQNYRTERVFQALENALRHSVQLLLPTDPGWPASFSDLGDGAPLLLWVRGEQLPLFNTAPSIALVGARAATAYGEHMVRELSGDLAADGITVVSGGAYGIDGAAHRAALGVGGRTIAVLAGGVERDYPAGHQSLFERIEKSGALISEVPCGTVPLARRFLSRNRLISSIAQATVVVEAGWRSGSLNTANHAASIGRPLGAVPGPVTSAASAGCHRLLREYGATCVTTSAEVRELMGGSTTDSLSVGSGEMDSIELELWEALSSRTARTLEELVGRTGQTIDTTTAQLGLWQLEGRAATNREGAWKRVAG